MVIKIPTSETLENVNRYTKSFLKPFLATVPTPQSVTKLPLSSHHLA